jgi:hypothetical protein
VTDRRPASNDREGHDDGGHDGEGHLHENHDHDHEGHDQHAGHSVAMFRSRFWISLVLTLPVVFWSDHIQHLLGYTAPVFPGSEWIPAALGTVVFFYGGLVFLQGAWRELKDRLPGMMTLISLAIAVAFLFSVAVDLGLVEATALWWELATLVTIMLLGHWIEMRSISQAQGALQELARLLPDEATCVHGGPGGDGARDRLPTRSRPGGAAGGCHLHHQGRPGRPAGPGQARARGGAEPGRGDLRQDRDAHAGRVPRSGHRRRRKPLRHRSRGQPWPYAPPVRPFAPPHPAARPGHSTRAASPAVRRMSSESSAGGE